MGAVNTISDLLSQIDLLMCVCAIAAYTFSLVVYRLYFSPLSGFPGPKLTAATEWYVTYFQVVKDGQFWRKIPEWHEKYGPIVRISPTELHISDPEFYDTIYTTDVRDRVHLRNALPTARSSTHSTVDHFLHQRRRAALSPLFSRLNIQKFIPLIQSRVDIIVKRINTEYKGTDRVLNLGNVFSCFTADVVMECSFGSNYGFCEREGFTSEFMEATHSMMSVLHWTAQFPILAWIMNSVSALPYRIMKEIVPKNSGPVLSWLEDIRIELRAVMYGTKEKTGTTQSTIFHEILKSDLPPEEKSEKRLHDEAQVVVAAGIETTQWTLTVAMFYLLDNSELLSKLRAEILTVFPDPSSPPSLATLEKLPYLTAVVQEALRCSIGLHAHGPRVAHKPLSYTDPTTGRTYTIPADTPLSCATPMIHYNESIFPSSHSFIPERWLSDPITGQPPKVKLASGEEKPLTKFLVTFLKGSRQCLGMNLAYAEIYLALASFTRKCEFELWQTTHEAVEAWSEHNVPTPKPGTGVRVKVL
ncbi:62617b23-89bd-4035-8aed-b9edcdd21241 [Sclerotinia trifoliorum]|uniref:62617b23-89bd-4035-8aed-b9edcdd21241 n=1 Tax=Sclerotinia trifoliorum TaxID=28548 RepID=A0A8H2ZQS0_9HELO|nr:62617b23-89bd-4035-8aed-b9edcdd21241 [Sclerotinia trifoliorum]